MRFLLRPLFIYLVSLSLLARLLPFCHFAGENSLLLATLALFMLNVILKPFIKVLLLPINLITLGLFSWMIHVVIVFLATLAVPGFSLSPALFPAIKIGIYFIPSIHLGLIPTYLFFSFILAFTVGFFDWLLVREE